MCLALISFSGPMCSSSSFQEHQLWSLTAMPSLEITLTCKEPFFPSSCSTPSFPPWIYPQPWCRTTKKVLLKSKPLVEFINGNFTCNHTVIWLFPFASPVFLTSSENTLPIKLYHANPCLSLLSRNQNWDMIWFKRILWILDQWVNCKKISIK